jgi:pyrroloquinoline-quinone synthase
MSTASFLAALDATIARHDMLTHPFYQAWSEGTLSRESIARYAEQYYAHVAAFPTYVSAVHSHCDDIETRQMLLENLLEEERGVDNHPDLWMRFAEGIGTTRDAVRGAKLLQETAESVARMRVLSGHIDYRAGLAALYAYESQIPAVSLTKREGLARFYGISDERTVQFFRVHEEADIIHRQVERDVLAGSCRDRASQDRVLRAADEAAQALWYFLDGVHRALCLEPATN